MDNFIFENGTKTIFGKGCVKEYLECLTGPYNTVMLAYGGGSIKRNGIYDEVTGILAEAGKAVVEFPGIMANPTYAKVQEGAALVCEKNKEDVMEKPFVVCHMFTSVNGKIDGEFIGCPDGVPARTEYGNLRSHYNCEAVLYGTVTMAGGFSDGVVGELPVSTVHYPKETWVAPSQVERYVVAVDPKGTLGWDSPYMEKRGRAKAHVIEALTEQVTEDYLAYLRERGVSYVVAGREQLDCALLLHELKTRFSIQRLMMAGGGYVNGSFLQAGLIDEVSIVLAPVADGNIRAVSAFENHAFLANQAAVSLSLLDVQCTGGDGLWLRYAPKNLA